MNYQEMTDAQLNLAVAEAHFGIKAELEDDWSGDVPRLYYRESGEVFIQSEDLLSGEWHTFDPISLWGQAGPIAQQNKINIYFSNNENMADHSQTGKESITCTDYNPCRAICIVFLMMKGGE